MVNEQRLNTRKLDFGNKVLSQTTQSLNMKIPVYMNTREEERDEYLCLFCKEPKVL